jgi:hypothetical protein
MGLSRASVLALLALGIVLLAGCAPSLAVTGTPPRVLRFYSAHAPYNEFHIRYEGNLSDRIQFDFSVDRSWLQNTTNATLHFVATMDPEYEKKLDIYVGKESELDISLAASKRIEDGRLVQNCWKAEPPTMRASDIPLSGAANVSVNFTFQTAGSWKIYILYDIPGTGMVGGEDEDARIYINGNPDTVSGINGLLSVLLLVPMGAQALAYFKTRLARKRTG